MSLASFSIRRRVTILMATLGILVFGGFSLNRLDLKLLPEISYPTLTVRTDLEGAPPEEVEDLVSRPIEEILATISNLEQITSVSRAGLSDVIVEFHWNTSMDDALMDVREKLDTIVLPESAERSRILRYNPETEPVLKLSLTGDNLVQMHEFAEKEIKPRLETIDGVAAARIMGGDEEEILIEIDTRRLSTMNLSLSDVANRIGMENINQPGGMLEEGNTQYLVRTVNEFQTEEDIGNIVIGVRGNIDVRLRDVADIARTKVEKKTVTHLNGRESVLIDLYKEGDANIITVTDLIRDELGSEKPGPRSRRNTISTLLPDDMNISVISDQSVFIRAAVNEVRSAAIWGCLLAVFVLYLFMRNLPNTLIIGLSIPVSIVATFTLMFFKGISLNLMSLGGLALGIGMLVDNSIVVLENVFRLKEEGKPNSEAARIGTENVTTAVIASTLTTVAVFFPIVFVKGIAGQIFNDLAWTIAFSLLASLMVALSLIPMIASLGSNGSEKKANKPIPVVAIWRKHQQDYSDHTPVQRFFGGIMALVDAAFMKLAIDLRDHPDKAFRPPLNTQGLAGLVLTVLLFPFRFPFYLLSFVLSITAASMVNLSWLICAVPFGIFSLLWSLTKFIMWPVLWLFNDAYKTLHKTYLSLLGYSLKNPFLAPAVAICALCIIAYIVVPQLGMNLIPDLSQGEFLIDIKLPVGSPLSKTRQAVGQIESILEVYPEVETLSAVIGTDMTTSTSLGAEQEHMATVQILLKDEFRNRTVESRVMNAMRSSLSSLSVVEKLEFRRPALFTLKTPLEVEIRGRNLDNLMTVSQDFSDKMSQFEEFKDVHSTMESGYPEIQIVFDRVKLARLGMTPNTAANLVRHAIEGDIPTDFGNIGEEIDIRIRASRNQEMSLSELSHLVIDPTAEQPVFLSSVAEITRSVGPSEIRRIDQRRVAIVKADTPMLDLRSAKSRIYSIIDRMPDNQGIYYAVTGQTQEMEESSQSLIIALLMAVFLVYLVMASQFESLVQPLIILFSIPLGMIGVLAGLYILNISLSAVVFIGLIVLAGIVVNNAIVLVDTANRLFRDGMPLIEAITAAGDRRLRPIMMTALTTILGLLPMAIASGPGQEIRQPLAITVILGLFVSTFLTLIVIPTIYALVNKSSADSGK